MTHENDAPDNCQQYEGKDKIIDIRDKLMRMVAPDTCIPIREAKSKDLCAECGKEATVFTDELSRREYKIVQLCQVCQDAFYG